MDSSGSESKVKWKVLYVDDEPALLELGKIFLEKSGLLELTISESPKDALELLEEEDFDAIISDYQMPGMDGIGFLKALKAKGSDTPFIIFTGKGREEVVIEALNNGADFYIQKGGDPKSQFAELIHYIQFAIERRRSKDAFVKQDAMEAAIDGMAIYDDSGKLVYANQAYVGLYGYGSLDDIMGLSWIELIPQRDVDTFTNVFNHVFEKSGSFRGITIGRRRNGTEFPQEICIQSLDRGGYITVVRDETERFAKEAQLEYSNSFRELLLDITHSIIGKTWEDAEIAIESALGRMAEFVGAERANIFQIDYEEGTYTNTHEWVADGLPSVKENMQHRPVSELGSALQLLEDQGSVFLDEKSIISDPAIASMMEKFDVKSTINHGIFGSDGLRGFVGFDSVTKNKIFNQQDDDLLKVFSDLISTIIERMAAESRLIESEKRSRSILRAFPDMAFILDRQGTFMDYNASDQSHLLLPAEKFIGRSLHEVLPEIVADQSYYAIESLERGEDVKPFTYSMETPAGERDYELRMNRMENGFLASVRDITDISILNRELQEKDERLTQLQDFANIGTFEQDIETGVVTWSDELFRVIGVSKEDFGGTVEDILDMVPPEDVEMVKEANAALVESGRDYRKDFSHRLIKGTGETIWVKVSAINYEDRSGRLKSIGLVMDITSLIDRGD